MSSSGRGMSPVCHGRDLRDGDGRREMNGHGDAWTMFRTVSFDNPVFGSEDSDTTFLFRFRLGASGEPKVRGGAARGSPVDVCDAGATDCGCCWVKKQGSYPDGIETPLYLDCETGKLYTSEDLIPAGHGICVINIVGEHTCIFGFSSGGAEDPCPQGSDDLCIISCPCQQPPCQPPSQSCQFPDFWYAEVGERCDCPALGQQKANSINLSHGTVNYKCLLCLCAKRRLVKMRRLWVVAVVVTALAVTGGEATRREAPRYPVPPAEEGRRTKRWVLEDYLPYLADRYVWYSQTYGRDWYLRSGWSMGVYTAILATMYGGQVGECPGSLAELQNSRFLAFWPVDRFPQTPLRGAFLKEGRYTLQKSTSLASLHPADESAILGAFGEGTVLFREHENHYVTIAIIHEGQSERGGALKPMILRASCWRDRPPGPVHDHGALWAQLAQSLFEFAASYTAFTGIPPATIRDLDGKVGQWNPRAWDDPEMGPVLREISERMIAVLKGRVPPMPALGEFEPVSPA
ncbi:MAG: hypothetical protein V2G42_07000 [bacterium JZ-2024 1]